VGGQDRTVRSEGYDASGSAVSAGAERLRRAWRPSRRSLDWRSPERE